MIINKYWNQFNLFFICKFNFFFLFKFLILNRLIKVHNIFKIFKHLKNKNILFLMRLYIYFI